MYNQNKNNQKGIYFMNIGDKIEDFTLNGIDENAIEREFSLSEFEGQNVVLYFYPKDDTPGCTQEACDFRDNFNRLISHAVVIGVSPDDIDSHKKFQEKHSLNFILLSDTEHLLAEEFGVWQGKSMYGNAYMGINRSTFLIDKNGILRQIWTNVKVNGHVDAVLDAIEELQ